jgi:hypothetical protein
MEKIKLKGKWTMKDIQEVIVPLILEQTGLPFENARIDDDLTYNIIGELNVTKDINAILPQVEQLLNTIKTQVKVEKTQSFAKAFQQLMQEDFFEKTTYVILSKETKANYRYLFDILNITPNISYSEFIASNEAWFSNKPIYIKLTVMPQHKIKTEISFMPRIFIFNEQKTSNVVDIQPDTNIEGDLDDKLEINDDSFKSMPDDNETRAQMEADGEFSTKRRTDRRG